MPNPTPTQTVEVTARANIALVKYWGKADSERNIPAVGSLSLTLDGLETVTRIEPTPGKDAEYLLDRRAMRPDERQRIATLLQRAGVDADVGFRFITENRFPTAAGLASSASGGAAAILAVCHAFDLAWDSATLLKECLRVSGSAPRSLFGGFARLDPDGSDVSVRPLPMPDSWDLRVLIVQTAAGPKKISSRDAMRRSLNSPFYPSWVETHQQDLEAAETAIAAGNFDGLMDAMEHSTLKMHTLPLTCRPPVWYWTPATLAVLQEIRERRAQGWRGGFTMDAGPHVKLFTHAADAPRWQKILAEMAGVHHVLSVAPGAAPEILVDGKEVSWTPPA